MDTGGAGNSRTLIDRVVDEAERRWVGDPATADTRLGPVFAAVDYKRGASYKTEIPGGKAAIAARVLHRKLRPLTDSLNDPDLPDRADYPIGPLRDGIEQLIGILFDNRVVVAETMKGVTAYTASHGRPNRDDNADPRNHVRIDLIFAPLLEAASSRRLLARDADPLELATMLSNMAILLGFTRSGESRTIHARQLQQFLLDGVLIHKPNIPLTAGTAPTAFRVEPASSPRARAIEEGMRLLTIHLGFQPDPTDSTGWRLADTTTDGQDTGTREALSWLTLDRVADALTGTSPADLLAEFGSADDYLDAVLAHVLRAQRQHLHFELAETARGELPATADPVAAIVALADHDLAVTARNPTFAIQALLAAHAIADPAVADHLAGMYDSLTQAWKHAYADVAASLGSTIATPSASTESPCSPPPSSRGWRSGLGHNPNSSNATTAPLPATGSPHCWPASSAATTAARPTVSDDSLKADAPDRAGQRISHGASRSATGGVPGVDGGLELGDLAAVVDVVADVIGLGQASVGTAICDPTDPRLVIDQPGRAV